MRYEEKFVFKKYILSADKLGASLLRQRYNRINRELGYTINLTVNINK
jgi:hypothetical protein